ncbi:dihydrodipicolinate synthase family protein [Parerythrobacter lacustris]|uniref:Dihydrodipicolinate synthase family protein n=1 Tax=Parerythrobacter lacustris TaxID=2969984 RepID=A0ABT1XPA9_9SPHN|nr:dihydrodipicolinate synthase family protein [Parerythrobacter lacustris]MCR2833503.1 dihydrodipicolinate synthase family protein [Parerythrobacter lacustris]
MTGASASGLGAALEIQVERKWPDASTSQRKWARDNLHGLMSLFLPSFLPDGRTLDEEAIRHDVRHALAQGFAGTMPMINWTLPEDPRWEELYRIVIDEAAGKLPVHGMVAGRDPETDRAQLARLERLGVDLVLLASTYPAGFDAAALYDLMARRIRATELPVMLYAATGRRSFPGLGPAGQPLDVYDRIADLPNTVAVKVSQPVSLTSTFQLAQRLGDRLSIGPVNLDFLPLLAREVRIAWSGQWNAEAIQTPQEQLGNSILEASARGDFAALDRLAVRIEPVLSHFFAVQAPVIRMGAHPWQHNRYYQWLGGGNGGLLPIDPHAPEGAIPTLDAKARKAMRAAFAASGLTPTDSSDDEFVVGRTAWARGVRPRDLAGHPYYSHD